MKIITQKSIPAKTLRMLCLICTIAFIALVLGTSDIVPLSEKIKIFLLMTAFIAVAYTRPVRRVFDPGYEDENSPVLRTGPNRRVTNPNERAVAAQHNPFFQEKK